MEYPVKLKLRLDWSEMDLFGHINNVMFFKYIQASRVNYWESTGLYGKYMQTGIGPILASTGCRFLKPLHYPGEIVVQARMDFIKNTSFGLHHQLLDQKNEPAAEASDVIVMYDFNQHTKVAFPDWLRAEVEKLERRKF
jgi:acyl-CoA thioester hydrolase